MNEVHQLLIAEVEEVLEVDAPEGELLEGAFPGGGLSVPHKDNRISLPSPIQVESRPPKRSIHEGDVPQRTWRMWMGEKEEGRKNRNRPLCPFFFSWTLIARFRERNFSFPSPFPRPFSHPYPSNGLRRSAGRAAKQPWRLRGSRWTLNRFGVMPNNAISAASLRFNLIPSLHLQSRNY